MSRRGSATNPADAASRHGADLSSAPCTRIRMYWICQKSPPPARSRRSTAIALAGATKSLNRFEPSVIRKPSTQRLSLIVTGTPASGIASPAFARRSTSAARRRMSSGSNNTMALRWGLPIPILRMASSACSTAVLRPDETACAISAIDGQGANVGARAFIGIVPSSWRRSADGRMSWRLRILAEPAAAR